TDQNPAHTYDLPGIYTVSLTVTGSATSDTTVRENYIVVGSGASSSNALIKKGLLMDYHAENKDRFVINLEDCKELDAIFDENLETANVRLILKTDKSLFDQSFELSPNSRRNKFQYRGNDETGSYNLTIWPYKWKMNLQAKDITFHEFTSPEPPACIDVTVEAEGHRYKVKPEWKVFPKGSGTKYKAVPYSNCSDATEVTLTMAVLPADSGTTEPSTGTHTVAVGEPVTITATPALGYSFDKWTATESVTIAAPNAASTTALLSSNGTITANFKNKDAAQYYVSPAGNDNNPGTVDATWKTINKAADTLVAGDTVYIREGTYYDHMVPQNSGTEDNPIVYTAWPGETVTIDGEGFEVEHGLFYINGKSYLTVNGLKIINSKDAGVYVRDSDHITISNNKTYNTYSSGIGVWSSSNVTVDSNEVELCCNDGEQECISLDHADNFVVKNNWVHDSGPGSKGGEGIDAKNGSHDGEIFKNIVHDIVRLGIYIDAWKNHTYNIKVYDNMVYKTRDGLVVASEEGGLLENIQVYNNIAYKNYYNGFGLTRNGDAATQPMKDIYVVNNTFYANGNEEWGGGIVLENPDIENVVIRNNICSQNVKYQILMETNVPQGNITVDHNLIDGFRGFFDEEIYGSDYVEGDPLFVNQANADFHIKEGSPAIDKGSSTGAQTDDFDGTPRPQGAGIDIGAFEFSK
ncbi:MAG TPA: right-handed parallel beta-helix repeat-containing protein, partial [Thermodesulfovibrionia bacterium]|nr:right-handed parallel beta-helix repeat-containing protein [Thermodesulfovibrionia bacterium]